jgi:hypothetical protein
MENKQLVLRKIALQPFIETLVNVYNSGADYIDLVGTPEETQDIISIVVHQDYISEAEEGEESFELVIEEDEEEEEEEQSYTKIDPLTGNIIPPLSDDDINELI